MAYLSNWMYDMKNENEEKEIRLDRFIMIRLTGDDYNTLLNISLIYKSRVKASDRPKVTCSKDTNNLLMGSWDPNTLGHVEEFKILLLNRSNAVLGIMEVSKGGISGTVTDIRIILQAAIKANASGMIVCHNHPSGNLNPSESDTRLTQKIKEAGNIIDIQLLDHLILTLDDNYYSFADNGLC
jgi:DNA repair protein RadC